MPTFNEIQDVILTWIKGITLREVVLDHDGQSPKPRGAYATVIITPYTVSGNQDSILSEDGLTETIKTQNLISVGINFYGANAIQDASKLSHSLYSAKRYEDLWQIIGFGECKEIEDLTALETGAQKVRARLVINFHAQLTDTFDSDYFDQVDVTVNNEERNYSETYTIKASEE